MSHEDMIPLHTFCVHYQVEDTFIRRLADYGLVETRVVRDAEYILGDAVGRAEKLVRLHHELHIHPEDLDVVSELLDKLEAAREELRMLTARLRSYEGRSDDAE